MVAPKRLPMPSPGVPMDDPRWYAWFQQLERRNVGDPNALDSLVVGAPTDDDMGAGTINAEEIYEDGNRVFVQTGGAAGGVSYTEFSHGTAGASITPNPSVCPKQYVVNNGAFTIVATSEVGDVELRVENGSTPGAITFSGFNKNWTGDPLTVTGGHQFIIFIYGYSAKKAYLIKALQ